MTFIGSLFGSTPETTQPGEVYREFGTPRAMTTEEAFREAFSDEGIRYEYVWNYPSEIVMRYPSARRW